MTSLPPHLYMQRGLAEGRPPAVVEHAVAEMVRLEACGVVPILTLGHLAHLTGASYGYLREVVERRRDPYTDISRPKRGGGLRAISSPEPFLMEVQRWILRNPLRSVATHSASYAYQEQRSIVHCARRHLGARWLVKMDLHDFFGSIDETRVYRVFRARGYSPLVSLELARLCTRMPFRRWPDPDVRARYPKIQSYAVNQRSGLPQGGPTSGALANAVAFRLDQRLSRVAARFGVVYTRYSDDLTFSAGGAFDRSQAVRLMRNVRGVVESERFMVHANKTHVVPPGARHVILGLVLGPDRVQLMPEFKRRIEVHVRGVEKFGLAEHAAHRGFRSIVSFVNHVEGCLAFAFGVERGYASQARERWEAALAGSGFLEPVNS